MGLQDLTEAFPTLGRSLAVGRAAWGMCISRGLGVCLNDGFAEPGRGNARQCPIVYSLLLLTSPHSIAPPTHRVPSLCYNLFVGSCVRHKHLSTFIPCILQAVLDMDPGQVEDVLCRWGRWDGACVLTPGVLCISGRAAQHAVPTCTAPPAQHAVHHGTWCCATADAWTPTRWGRRGVGHLY